MDEELSIKGDMDEGGVNETRSASAVVTRGVMTEKQGKGKSQAKLS